MSIAPRRRIGDDHDDDDDDKSMCFCSANIVAFLKPWSVATDRIQSDAATLITFYTEYTRLHNAMTAIANDNTHILRTVATTAIKVLKQHACIHVFV
jgi:hypothetical protein